MNPVMRMSDRLQRSADHEGGSQTRSLAESQLEEFAPAVQEAPDMMSRAQASPQSLMPLYNVPVEIAAVLGRAVMSAQQLLKLKKGDVIELDRKLGQLIDIYVNNRLVARGEVVLNDERLGITMTETVRTNAQS